MRGYSGHRCAAGMAVGAVTLMMAAGSAAGVKDPGGNAAASDTGGQAVDAPAARFDKHRVVRVEMRSARDAAVMQQLSDDPWTCRYGPEAGGEGGAGRPGVADFRVSPEALEALKASGIPYRVLIEDVQALIDAEAARLIAQAQAPQRPVRGPGWYSDFKSYDEVNTYLDGLAAGNPSVVSRVNVGTTVLGRAITGVRVSGPGVAVGSKPQVVVISGQHAREWVTVMSTVYLADTLSAWAASDASVQRLLNNFELYIIPIVNPDGYVFTWPTTPGNNRLWRKNRRDNGNGTIGVDLNRNWGFRWGGVGSSGTTSSDTYRGPSAFSEPETTAVADFTRGLSNPVLFYDIHSFSQLILEPWGDTFNLPPEARTFGQMSRAMQNAIFGVAGSTFVAGPGFRVIYATTGVADEWAYGDRGVLGFGMELRDVGQTGFILPPAQIVPSAQEAAAAVRAGMDWLLSNSVGVDFLGERPARVAAGGTTSVRVQFNQGLRRLANLGTTPPSVSVRAGRVGAFTTTTLSNLGVDETTAAVFSHGLSGGACGSVVQWFYTVPLSDGTTITVPPEGAARAFEAVAQTFTSVASTDFETTASATGWVVGDAGDTTTPGAWVRGNPNGTQCQVEFDFTPLAGASCFYTGQNTRNDTFGVGRVGETSTGANQVQKTTLLSPTFALGSATRAEVRFALTYANSRQYDPDDGLSIDITYDAAAATPTWTPLYTIAPSGPVGETTALWNTYRFTLDRAGGLGNVRLRWVARENGNGDAVEVALDEFAVSVPVCDRAACAADYNGDGTASVQDLFDFLGGYFAGAASADVNGSGALTVQDIFDYLALYFAGCA